MLKNSASQKLRIYVFDSTTNLPKTADAANLTAYVNKDYAGLTVLADTSATEEDATNGKGFYLFDLAQAETNADILAFACKSTTANMVCLPMPATVFTRPALFTSLAIDSTGRVNAFLIGILTSVFTEGATGRVAAAFKQFFNIASPAATMDAGVLVATATTLTNAPSDSSGVTTLLSRLSALRAGYLDNLSAGAVALEASLQGLITTIGASAAGVAMAVWSAVTRTLTAGTNIVLAKGTGVTGFNDIAAGAAMTLTAAYDAAKTAATQTSVDDLPTNAELATALGTADDATLAAVAAARAVVDAIKLSTDNLPSDPADQSLIIAATNSLASAISGLSIPSLAAIAAQIISDHGSGSYVRNTEPPSAVAIAAAVHTDLETGNPVVANVKQVNDVDLQGDGTLSDLWRPA